MAGKVSFCPPAYPSGAILPWKNTSLCRFIHMHRAKAIFKKRKSMETQENQFTEMACTRYQHPWRGFEAIFRRGESATLSAYCESVHVNYNGMKHWVAANGLSVRRLKKCNRISPARVKESAFGEKPDMFVQFIPPSLKMSDPMRGVCINFPDGTYVFRSIPAHVTTQVPRP